MSLDQPQETMKQLYQNTHFKVGFDKSQQQSEYDHKYKKFKTNNVDLVGPYATPNFIKDIASLGDNYQTTNKVDYTVPQPSGDNKNLKDFIKKELRSQHFVLGFGNKKQITEYDQNYKQQNIHRNTQADEQQRQDQINAIRKHSYSLNQGHTNDYTSVYNQNFTTESANPEQVKDTPNFELQNRKSHIIFGFSGDSKDDKQTNKEQPQNKNEKIDFYGKYKKTQFEFGKDQNDYQSETAAKIRSQSFNHKENSEKMDAFRKTQYNNNYKTHFPIGNDIANFTSNTKAHFQKVDQGSFSTSKPEPIIHETSVNITDGTQNKEQHYKTNYVLEYQPDKFKLNVPIRFPQFQYQNPITAEDNFTQPVLTEKQLQYQDQSKKSEHIRPIFVYEKQFEFGKDKIEYETQFQSSYQKRYGNPSETVVQKQGNICFGFNKAEVRPSSKKMKYSGPKIEKGDRSENIVIGTDIVDYRTVGRINHY